MTTTPKNLLTHMGETQANAHILYNEFLNRFDFLSGCVPVESRTTTAQPGSPTNGQAYLLPASSTGASWASQDGKIAVYMDGWQFITPWAGLHIWSKAEKLEAVYDGSAWLVINGYGTSMPNATTLAFGSKFTRTDLGESFILMDASVWTGGSGKAWVGEAVTPFGFGRNVTSNTSGVFVAGYGSAGNLDADTGIAIDVDMMIVSATICSGQTMDGTVTIRNASTDLLTLTFSSSTQASMSRAASAWQRINAGGVLTVGPSTMVSGNYDDPILTGSMRRVIDA